MNVDLHMYPSTGKPPGLTITYQPVNRLKPDPANPRRHSLDWFKKPFPGQGIFELYRREAEAAERRRQPQPAQTTWAIGSMEWLAEQNKPK
jgi:hypothetical protein